MNISKTWHYQVILSLLLTFVSNMSFSIEINTVDTNCAHQFLNTIIEDDTSKLKSKVIVLNIADVASFPGGDTVLKNQGAIFVPALTSTQSEPFWSIYDADGELIQTSKTNKVIALNPGCYSIEIGSGRKNQLEKINVLVESNKVSKVQPTLGALVIHTIDEEETPYRGLYLLFDFISRDDYGFGRGAEEESGERVNTWLLKPGFYKIVGPLESFDAKKNFTIVEVEPGKVKHHVIVMTRESGDFLGAGLVPDGDFTVRGSITGRPSRVQMGGFVFKARIGGDFSQNSSDDQVGLGGNSLGFGLFTDFSANYLYKKHFFNLFLNLEGGVRKNSDENFIRKVRDELSLSSIYIHQTWPLVGGYARLQATSQFADTLIRFEDETSVIVDNDAPQTVDNIRVSSTLNPLFLEQGIGLNFRIMKKVYADLDARVGFSMRETVTRSGFIVDDDSSSTDAVELKTLHSDFASGGELVLVGSARFAQVISYRLDANTFHTGSEFSMRINNTLSFRIAKSFSIGFLLGFRRDETTNYETNYSQGLFVRASKQVF